MQWAIVLRWIKIMVDSMAYSVAYKKNAAKDFQNLLLRSFEFYLINAFYH